MFYPFVNLRGHLVAGPDLPDTAQLQAVISHQATENRQTVTNASHYSPGQWLFELNRSILE